MTFSVLSLYEFGSNNLVTFYVPHTVAECYTRNKLSPQDGDINPVFRRILKSNEEDWGQHSPEHRIYIWTIYPTSCNHLSLEKLCTALFTLILMININSIYVSDFLDAKYDVTFSCYFYCCVVVAFQCFHVTANFKR